MPRILVVEDNDLVGTTVCRALRAAGLQPTLVTTLAAAQEAFTSQTWDGCVTDLSLPNGDGIDAVIAAREAGVRACVVFSAHSDSALAHAALREGALDFFIKPEGLGQIAPVLWRAIRQREQEQPMSDPNATISPAKARKAGPLARLSKATREQAAVAAARKAEATAAPIKAFLAGAGRKIGGLAVAWWGTTRLEAASKVTGADKYVSLALGALAIVIGLMAFMPDITMTVLRFFGLGGLVDKVFLKRKTEEPSA